MVFPMLQEVGILPILILFILWAELGFFLKLSLGRFLCHVMACFVALIRTVLVADFVVLFGTGLRHV